VASSAVIEPKVIVPRQTSQTSMSDDPSRLRRGCCGRLASSSRARLDILGPGACRRRALCWRPWGGSCGQRGNELIRVRVRFENPHVEDCYSRPHRTSPHRTGRPEVALRTVQESQQLF